MQSASMIFISVQMGTRINEECCSLRLHQHLMGDNPFGHNRFRNVKPTDTLTQRIIQISWNTKP